MRTIIAKRNDRRNRFANSASVNSSLPVSHLSTRVASCDLRFDLSSMHAGKTSVRACVRACTIADTFFRSSHSFFFTFFFSLFLSDMNKLDMSRRGVYTFTRHRRLSLDSFSSHLQTMVTTYA